MVRNSYRLILAALSAMVVLAGCGGGDPIAVGSTPPSFTVESLQGGSKVDSASLKGKVVIVDFWATWCGPCREEMPQVEDIWKRYKDKGVEMMAVSNEAKDALGKFEADHPGGAPIFVDSDGRVNSMLGIVGYPTTFVLGKDGRVIYNSVGYSDAVPREIEAAVSKATASS